MLNVKQRSSEWQLLKSFGLTRVKILNPCHVTTQKSWQNHTSKQTQGYLLPGHLLLLAGKKQNDSTVNVGWLLKSIKLIELAQKKVKDNQGNLMRKFI